MQVKYAVGVCLVLIGCGAEAPTPALPAQAQALQGEVRVAIIGDFGVASRKAQAALPAMLTRHRHDPSAEGDVAALVRRQHPAYVFTVGDNNYPSGSSDTLDDNIGQFYSDFIAPYRGRYGVGARVNRFFPALGNHDWGTAQAEPYLSYFGSLPAPGRYYDVQLGPVHFFVVDSDEREPDGIDDQSKQAKWFKDRIKRSTAPFKVVTLHHPPYASGDHEDKRLRWHFAKWGVDAVIAGHHHVYERLEHDGIPYVINGVGGAPLAKMGKIDPESLVRYNDDFGALFLKATPHNLEWQLINRRDQVVDAWVQ